MRRLSAFIVDRRYSVPTLRIDIPAPLGGEIAIAEAILHEGPDHLSVEIRDGDEVIARADRPKVHAYSPDLDGSRSREG